MKTVRRMIFASVAATLIAGSITPAIADHRGGRGYGNYRHHDRDRLDAGEVIGIVAVVGLIAAIASSGSKAKRRAREGREGVDNRDYDSGPYQKGAISSENEAVDACALAAEDRAGKRSSVRDVTNVASNSGGWDVEGVVEARDTWRDKRVQAHNFSCVVREGSIKAVFVDVNPVVS